MNFNELTVKFTHLKRNEILQDWVWLIGKDKLPILITSFGCAFVQGRSDGKVYFLDVLTGELTQVASSPEKLQEKLNIHEFSNQYLHMQLVDDLMDAGVSLEHNQVYSFKHPLVLGGVFESENIEVSDISVHFSFHGQVHEKVKSLPEGADVNAVSIESKKKSWWKFW